MTARSKGETQPRIAIVHDWLVTPGGSERVLESLLPLYPDSPIYTLVYKPAGFKSSPIAQCEIRPSYVSSLPLARRLHRWYLPLMVHAVRGFDLSSFDIVISLSHAVAHGVRTKSNQLHINYIFTPARYAWQQREEYLDIWGLRGRLAQRFLGYFRRWDREVVQEVDCFVAISKWIAGNVEAAYGREADAIIYPPVNTRAFKAEEQREDFYIVVSRLVPYKRIDLVVHAFNRLGLPLLVVGDGREKEKLLRIANSNIRFLGNQGDSEVCQLLARAKAFVYASREDFGIAPVEAQAAGCPVIAFAGGALPESVMNGQTGILYSEQTAESLVEAITRFESDDSNFSPRTIAKHSAQFSKERFQLQFADFVSSAWQSHLASKLKI